jgi:hypothetical protein
MIVHLSPTLSLPGLKLQDCKESVNFLHAYFGESTVVDYEYKKKTVEEEEKANVVQGAEEP